MDGLEDINLEEELKKLEEEFSVTDNLMSRLSGPSTTEYWKKRVEEEKLLWQKILETKEQEKKQSELKLAQAQSEIVALQQQMKALQETLQAEIASWQEKLKQKETELAVEKERIEFSDRIKELEREKRALEEQINQLKEQAEKEKEELKQIHAKELEELVKTQEELIENLDSIEFELKKIESDWEAQKEKISQLTSERDQLTERVNFLSKQLEYKIQEPVNYESQLFDYFSEVTKYFVDIIRNSLGTILGLVNCCFKKLKLGFLSKNVVVKRQLIVVENVVRSILMAIDTLIELTRRPLLNLQELSIEKLFNKIHDEIDTSSLPYGLKVKVDVGKFVSSLREHCERASSMVATYDAVATAVNLKITTFEKIEASKLIQLKYVACLHRFIVTLNTFEDKSVIAVSIPCMKLSG